MALGVEAGHVRGHETLVGRADELGSLEQVLDELDRGRPGAVELVGEPGIGKTRLLRELGFRADTRGHTVLSGSATELERDLPFSVFVDALDDYVAGLDPRHLESLGSDVRAELATVFSSLARSRGRGRRVATHHERYRSHRAVRVLLEQLARDKPLALLLDDFHWADPASVELLGFLLRHPPEAAVLLALAVRPSQRDEQLRALAERAHRDGNLARLPLRPLSADEARTLLGESVDVERQRAIYTESEGNPFYLEQLARFMTGEEATAIAHPGTTFDGIDVPPAVAAALAEEIGLLASEARRVGEAAAVVGDSFDPELVAATAQVPEATVLASLDELLRVDLVRETELPRRFRFRHPLVWRAVYEATPAGWRIGAHERAAESLAARGAAAAARAPHVELSAREGDSAAVALLRQAGEAAAVRAPASAARWFGAALRVLPETAPSEERVELLLARAASLAATGRFAESRADLLDCIAIAPQGWRVRAATACAAVEQLLGLQHAAHSHLATALTELEGEESVDAVGLMIELTVDGFRAGDFDAMRSWAERAVAAATPVGERSLLAAALCYRAWASAIVGDGERAQTHCDEATEVVDELSDEDLAPRLHALAHLAGADFFLDRFPAATRHSQRALEIGRANGQGDVFPLTVAMLGGSLCVQGRPREAGELFDEAVEAARLAGNAQSLAWILFNRSFAALVAGDLDLALATAEESFALQLEMEPSAISAMAAAVLASALLEAGRADTSIDVLIAGAGGEELPWIGGSWRARFLELLTRALLATGRRADAERAAATAETCAAMVSLPSAAAMASLAAAAVALDAGQATAAAEHALGAAAALDAVAARFDAAHARALAGRALARAGDRERAALELELAATAFESFGSLRYRDQVERELRKLGRRIHRRTRPGTHDARDVTALTGRELEIARLVVDRKTNPQIAAELFLSQKTVETHLRNMFRKLDVSSRVELARTVERAEQAAQAGSR
jgi:DNA-binding NarL/FixJ family response regulator/tetratricopeptide (TPR) repeat protein